MHPSRRNLDNPLPEAVGNPNLINPSARDQIVADIKQALVSLVDERGVLPIIILEDAQGLRDDLLRELHGLTSLDFDGREYLTVWLVGRPLLARRLRLQQHVALAPAQRRTGRSASKPHCSPCTFCAPRVRVI